MLSPIFQFKSGTEWVVERPGAFDEDLLTLRAKDVKQYLVSADGKYEMDVEVFNAYFVLAGTKD